jgi:hypothetical protein
MQLPDHCFSEKSPLAQFGGAETRHFDSAGRERATILASSYHVSLDGLRPSAGVAPSMVVRLPISRAMAIRLDCAHAFGARA